jgi:ElaB/YqjD/DUF883 family membrane-anchored ribosome-binding protein
MDTTDLQSLREDLNTLKDTFAKFVSQAGTDAVKTARDVTSNVASQVAPGRAASTPIPCYRRGAGNVSCKPLPHRC